MKHTNVSFSKKLLPPGSVRKINPETGTRMWFIGGQWWRSKRDFFIAVQIMANARKAHAMIEQQSEQKTEQPVEEQA